MNAPINPPDRETDILLDNSDATREARIALLRSCHVYDAETGASRLASICENESQREALQPCLGTLVYAISESANPDHSLLNFERFVQRYDDRLKLFHFLAENPRAVEILVKLFVGSQFLTEILLRNPNYLEVLTNHKRLAEFKSRDEFYDEALRHSAEATDFKAQMQAVRHYQHWELLRIGACDSFGLMDFKSITLQLSLLADALVQACLKFAAQKEGVEPEGFSVLAFGKLGGEELNYSSDIDLVFIADKDASRFWPLGQSLIEAITKATADGFLYRVDMRLRPWGRSGALVASSDAYYDYLVKHGMLWEKQALLKARPIAGDLQSGRAFLKRIEPIIFQIDPEEARNNVKQMKSAIERDLKKQGRNWGEVKGGRGSIRDVEFTVQYLQLAYGQQLPTVRSINTLDGLVRLVDHDLIFADEYRQLSNAYVFLRTIEHALQLTHYKQIHHLPREARELAYLARKLDFPNAGTFVTYYERHGAAVRRIFEKYVEQPPGAMPAEGPPLRPLMELIAEAQPSYATTFNEEEIQRHTRLLDELGKEELVNVTTIPQDDGTFQVTIVGRDVPGQFSVTCGLLFAYGYDIQRGHVFTGLFPTENMRTTQIRERHGRKTGRGRFITVLEVQPPETGDQEEIWSAYLTDFISISERLHRDNLRDAQGLLAKRIGQALQTRPIDTTQLLPLELTIDNGIDENSTLMDISGEDVPGFLYELTTGLALCGMQIERVIVDSTENRVADRLYVTDENGEKLTDEAKLQILRAAVVLIKHFAHMLPGAPNPESALLHFREFLEQLFEQPDWATQLSSLEQPKVLDALARLLGVSDFLWEEFLRLQYSNLFPVVTDIESLSVAKDYGRLDTELSERIELAETRDEQVQALNAFKDREMVRTDMRHILGYEETFGQFSQELTSIAEVVIKHAIQLCWADLEAKYGRPQTADGKPCDFCVAALGKCGGYELGFASDIELMFIYDQKGSTSGPEATANNEFFHRLVEGMKNMIRTKRDGIFEIDLRLRPYGKAGSLAVSLQAFENYFAPEGPAWPYERQALVKLRPIVGPEAFCERVVELRNRLVYTGEPFDAASMRAIREKQIRQLVTPDTINAKLSLGGLVDCEYLIQGLQITYGGRFPELRTPNTREALRQLEKLKILTHEDRIRLRDSYRFLRRLIDALRMVRGDARELTVPKYDTEEFEYLARRLGYQGKNHLLLQELEEVMQTVIEIGRFLDGAEEDTSPDTARSDEKA
ncbi:glutamine synthetase adenylyltransferase [Rubinisphaera sp. JC750]|uniref:[protein-PII] uridylyltransferase family protein n=1 Tax=Rubinisphaera sp. JC750 TaxID=2898658 RepID=UPI001F1A321E|nr:glutamine synthetase adenylyltransferase [Rubinisphaera sp. JC750]